jgi:hypothetical protein
MAPSLFPLFAYVPTDCGLATRRREEFGTAKIAKELLPQMALMDAD